jgi:hypothetical protein
MCSTLSKILNKIMIVWKVSCFQESEDETAQMKFSQRGENMLGTRIGV